MSPDLDAVVVGAGIAGLGTARTLQRAGLSFVVLEAGASVGGVARSERRDGYLFERGPNTFRVPPALAGFLTDEGLEGALLAARPASRKRFLLRGGKLLPVPMGVAAFVTTPLLSTRGKLRLLAEPFVARGDGRGESVAEFAARRLGPEAVQALIGPFLTGVYAGDENQLGAAAVFPALVEAERERGSIVRGMAARRRADAPRGLAGTWSHAEGAGGFAALLARPLEGALQRAHRVCEIAFGDDSYRIEIEAETGSRTIRARSLLLALPAPEAAQLLRGLAPAAAEALETVAFAPLASLSFGVDPAACAVAPEGFGFLVPRGESDALLGCLYPNQLFPGRAPEGRELLTALVGGVRRPDVLDEPDDRLIDGVLAELDRVLGMHQEPAVLGVTRWPRAVAQPARDHGVRIAAARRALEPFPRLALAGGSFDGVAFGEAFASGLRAGAAVAAQLRV